MNQSNLINPENYFDEKITEIEFDKIFSKEWIFASMDDDLQENNAFITLNIFNYPIVLQNFRGEIKAFENICTHRHNKIQTDTKGNRPLICKYHNWVFDVDGAPRKNALKKYFDIENESFNCLKSFKVAKVGKFVFICLHEPKKHISEFLGPFYEKLIKISNSINNQFYFEDDNQKINWKIIIENVIEAYHCHAIHKETLYEMGFCSIPESNQQYYEGHSVADYPKKNDVEMPNNLLKYLYKSTFKHDSFRHFFIFPNLVISSTEGTSIYIGNLLPIKSNETILRKRFYDVHFNDNYIPKKTIHNAFLEIVKSSINTILVEDKEVLEELQKNMKFARNTYHLGNEEVRIVDFHNNYLKYCHE